MSPPSRPTLTERRAEELRMTIALAARDIFLADEATSATVERICDAVGIAPRTFHRHFPVKEDVVMPLFRRFGGLSVEVLQEAPRTSDTVETLVKAFSTEVAKRDELAIDRNFMSLMITDPQYRLRWLDWGQDFAGPITDFLAERVDLGRDPFIRTLPAQLVIQICRQAYVHWVEQGDFGSLESALRAGMRMVIRALRPLTPAATRKSYGTRGREQ
ncbi:TetR family transcriptional regulator [Mycolicibacterium moriokaense]|uniref:TetR family transcriptional regulator n=2 Tax=Mycolicibacterium moriokaense TaxID=39691 RepID=A0A318HN14_9MYCO|nr:TetR family transcriptional regulator [Mycolicibacterium moriokaense]